MSKLNNGAPTGYTYRYDQLNRLKEMRYHPLTIGTTGWNSSSMAADHAYKESITYDGNGNILTYLRNGSGTTTPPAAGTGAGPVAMDQLTYNYNKVYNLQTNRTELQNNKLRQVQDAVADGNYSAAANGTDDIDNQTNADNYQYDKIGNLVKDVKESLDKIDWTVYGKIRQITKVNGTTIAYTYDAAGNRVKKTVTESGVVTTTWYARDAQGNTMAVYSDKQEGQAGTWWKEQHLYGSSRLGMWNPAINIAGANGTASWSVVGKKTYELANHLGNVLATITDKKIGVPLAGNSSLIDHYEAEVTSANDYYPFGMLMPGRKWSSGSYRYGFNGQEKSDEIKGEGNSYTAEFWEYDSRIGRRWNVDPKPNPSISTYNVFAGNPIWFSDPLGDSISPNRTKPMSFIVVPNKKMRDEDIKQHGKMGSAFYWDYKKAKSMEKRSKGLIKVIETDNAQDAIDQIKGSLARDQYVKNLLIDFHRHSGPFDDPQFGDGSMQKAFNDLADGYIGRGSDVYLGMCWSGGNQGRKDPNLTERASNWLDGATTYGHQAAASSISFVLFNHFSGPVFEGYGKEDVNLERRKYHTISYFEPVLGCVRSVEIKARVFIQSNGNIHMSKNVDLSKLPTIVPFMPVQQPFPVLPIIFPSTNSGTP